MKYLLLILVLTVLAYPKERTQVHMGTLITLDLEDAHAADAVFDLFRELDARLSTYKNDSEISRLNRRETTSVSSVTRAILERSLQMYRLSAGAFDVTIGSVTHDAYRFGAEERLPDTKTLHQALKRVGSERIRIGSDRIELDPGTKIDLGGIAKGYAVDLAVGLLHERGTEKGVIAASGDIGCIGPCDVRIADPFHPDGHIATVSSTLNRFAISTSGNYERYIKSKTHNHLIDPKSGMSEQRYASITLMDVGDNTRIDALATAVSVMEEEKALSLLRSLKMGYFLIRNDGKMIHGGTPEGVSVTMNHETAAKP